MQDIPEKVDVYNSLNIMAIKTKIGILVQSKSVIKRGLSLQNIQKCFDSNPLNVTGIKDVFSVRSKKSRHVLSYSCVV